ncbi:MAG: protein NO VEIN domain-containing protein [Isosphaerales bacterium]
MSGSSYINQFLPQASGRRQASVALARTVFQRRLASSTMAIFESIRRRFERQQKLLTELEELSPAQRARRFAQLQGRVADVEQDEDDLDDAERDELVDQFTAAAGLDQLRTEVAALQDLLAHARRVRDHATDSKLAALKACLERAEFKELIDGRGKLLIFTEHQDQHLDAVLIGPGHPLYAAMDERLGEQLAGLAGGIGVYVDVETELSYRLHFFEVSIRGQNSKAEHQTLHGELVAVREELSGPTTGTGRFSIVPADSLLDLPPHTEPPQSLAVFDPTPATDFIKITFQMELRGRCQEERRRFVDICRDYLTRSFDARVRAAQDRVMALRMREASQPEVAIARQRAENEVTDLARTRRERLAGLDRLILVKHGPVRHVGSALVLPAGAGAVFGGAPEDLDPNIRRRSELAAEDLAVAFEQARGWECERVGHQKIGFDVRSLGPADPQTGYRDPVEGIRRIEVKGRTKGHPIRLTTNEWYKASQLRDSYWLYVVWDPLGNPDPLPLIIRNPVKHLDHAKREVIAARHYDIPAQAVEAAAKAARGPE